MYFILLQTIIIVAIVVTECLHCLSTVMEIFTLHLLSAMMETIKQNLGSMVTILDLRVLTAIVIQFCHLVDSVETVFKTVDFPIYAIRGHLKTM